MADLDSDFEYPEIDYDELRSSGPDAALWHDIPPSSSVPFVKDPDPGLTSLVVLGHSNIAHDRSGPDRRVVKDINAKVQVLCKGKDSSPTWLHAIIKHVHRDGTVDVTYDDARAKSIGKHTSNRVEEKRLRSAEGGVGKMVSVPRGKAVFTYTEPGKVLTHSQAMHGLDKMNAECRIVKHLGDDRTHGGRFDLRISTDVSPNYTLSGDPRACMQCGVYLQKEGSGLQLIEELRESKQYYTISSLFRLMDKCGASQLVFLGCKC